MSSTEIEVYGQTDLGPALRTEHVEPTLYGLRVHEDVSAEEISRVVSGLDALSTAGCFGIGDLSNYFKLYRPEEYRAWIEQERPVNQWDSKTIKVYAATCREFPIDIREQYLRPGGGPNNRGLAFAHFQAVYRLGREQGEAWLRAAYANGWSSGTLAEQLDTGPPGGDDVPDIPGTPSAVFGQAYWLGPTHDPQRHLLVCGDATNAEHWAYLQHLAPKAGMVWTDPPYGVDYVGKTADALTIQHDSASGLEEMLTAAFGNIIANLEESRGVYIAAPSGDRGEVFLRSIRVSGLVFKQTLIWRKNTIVLGRSDYQYQHEPILYAATPGEFKMGRMVGNQDGEASRGNLWFGGDNSSSIFDVAKPAASEQHPTMKPVALIRPAIENSCRPGEVVVDPFSGSGSTLIACEQTGRRCFAIEFDPRYADVIIARYRAYIEEHDTLPVVEGTSPNAHGPSAFEE